MPDRVLVARIGFAATIALLTVLLGAPLASTAFTALGQENGEPQTAEAAHEDLFAENRYPAASTGSVPSLVAIEMA